MRCFAVRRGKIRERADVNYWRSSNGYEELYSQPKFPLVALRELVTLVQYGTSERAEVEPIGTPILRMNNLQASGWDLSDLKYVRLEPEVKDQLLLKQGDLLFNRTNSKELVGKCDVFREEGEWVFASYLIRVRLDENKALPFFISEFLNTRAGRIQIDRVSRQIIGMSNVNAEELRDLLIPLPPLAIQRTLVDEMEAARESRQRRLAQADELLQSLDSWLLIQLGLEPPPVDNRKVFAVRLGNIKGRVDPYFYQPKFEKVIRELASCRFPLQTIGTICEPPVGGATPTRGDAELYAEDGIKFLRILNVKPNEIDLTDVKYIRDAVHDGELGRSQLAASDVLMTITGRVGTAAVVPQDILPANINQHIVRLRVISNDCLPDYLAAYLNTSVGLAISNRSVTGGTRIALDYQAIRSLPIPVPPIRIQELVIEELDNRRASARRLRTEAEAEWQAAKVHFEEQLLTGASA